MDFIYAVVSGVSVCIAQGCCWYSIFQYCGCIPYERERVQTQPPIVVIHTNKNNPFLNPSAPKDAHLEPAYR